MSLVFSGYFNGVDAAEPSIPPDQYNTNYKLGFYYDTSLDSNGNTVMRVARVALQSNLRWYPVNFYGYTQLFGYAYLSVTVGSSSTKKEYGYDFNYDIYDPDGNPCSESNPVGGPNEPALFAYDGIEYPETKPHAPTITLPAGSEDSAIAVRVFVEIRDGEIGYLYQGNKTVSVTVPRNQWVVKLHPNGGVVDGSSAATVTKTKRYNQTLTIPTPTKTNAVFKGWYANAQGTGNPVSASYTQNADLELWAIWYEPYAVTYDGNPASAVTNVPAQQWKVYNQDLTLSSQRPTRSGGYVFKEWNTKSDGTGTSYAPGASYSANAALTLYAIWYPPYGIAYNGNGGSDTASAVSNVPAMQIKSHGVALTLSSQKPTRPGYSFASWNTNSSGTGTSYNPGDTYPASNNAHQVLYAIWTPTVDSKAVTVNKSVRTGSLSSETEADEGGYAFIDFSYSFVGAASGTVSVSVGRTPEGGTTTAVPAARISGDTAKTKSLGYGTLSGNVKVHDDGGGSLPTTTRYKYDITVTFAGTSATGASYIEKAFFTISVLGDGVSGQTPGHGIAFGMPATREAFEVGPSMPAHFWEALYAHQELIANGVRARSTPSYMASGAGWYRVGKLGWSHAPSSSGGAHSGIYPNCFLLVGGIYASARNTSAIFSVNVLSTEVMLTQIGKATVGWLTKVRLVFVPGSNGEYYVDVYLTQAQNSFTISTLGHASFAPNASLESVAEISDNPGVTIIGDALAPTGGTVTGMILSNTENNVAINFRDHTAYSTTASYQTAGNEALVFGTKNAVTSFIFANGEDSIQNHNSDRWYSITPGLQIKNNCVSIGALIPNGTTPTYKLAVNGTLNATGIITQDGKRLLSDLRETSDISNIDTFADSYLYAHGNSSGYASGTKPTGTNNAFGVLNLHTHTGNYYSQLGFDSSYNKLWHRASQGSSSWSAWKQVEFTDYVKPISAGGTGATTASGALSNLGAAASGHTHNYAGSDSAGGIALQAYTLHFSDTRSNNQNPNWYFTNYGWRIVPEFKSSSAIGSPSTATYVHCLTLTSWGDASGGYPAQIAIGNDLRLAWRVGNSGTTWSSWRTNFGVNLYANSSGSNGKISLSTSAGNYRAIRIYFKTNEGYVSSVDVEAPNGKYVALGASRGDSASTPYKAWVKSRVVIISGAEIYTDRTAYSEYGGNSSGTWGINPYNYIYILRVDAFD